jgi:hypothetical protein
MLRQRHLSLAVVADIRGAVALIVEPLFKLVRREAGQVAGRVA